MIPLPASFIFWEFRMRRGLVLLASLALWPASSIDAHVSMLLPSSPCVKKGEEVTFTYQWGHPFEHQLFDAPRPESLYVRVPGKPGASFPWGSTCVDLGVALQKTERSGAEGKPVTVWHFRYVPQERGDYVFVLTTVPLLIKEEDQLVQDTVKVVLHVQAERNWDREVGWKGGPLPMQFMPLTRPYGLERNMVVQARLAEAKMADYLVEFERYNATPPKKLPPEEHVTRTARTDPNGIVTGTLTEPGWWALTARRHSSNDARLDDSPVVELDGKRRALHRRAVLWVHVDERQAAK
jgi:hypothetical protein